MDKYPIDKLKLNAAVVELMAKLDAIGPIKLRFSNDVVELEAAQAALGKETTGEYFRRALDTLPPNRMFWIGAELDGRMVGTVAARCDDSAWSLQEFVKNYWERTFVGAADIQQTDHLVKVQIESGSPEAASGYRGRFAYLGEALTEPGMRSQSLSIVLVRLALLFVFDEWRPTVAYGWMRDWHAYRGLHVRWGFNRCETNAFDWRRPPIEKDWRSLAFLVCDQRGFRNLMKYPTPDAAFQKGKNNSEENEIHRTP